MSSIGAIEVPCVRIASPGGPHVLEHGVVTVPPPGVGEVRVRVVASGVNRADLLQREGRYPSPPGFDDALPGLEYAGEVESVGPACRLRKPGDRVMGILGGGGYAAAVTVPERETIRVPEGTSVLDAAAIPEAFLTAWDALFGQAGLTAGETLLVHAAGSGVGTAAIQLAHAAGAFTIGTSRTPSKLERARGLGLGLGIVAPRSGPDRPGGDAGSGNDPEGAADGREEPRSWSDRILEVTEGVGVDVILDLVGGGYLEENQRVLGPRGRWVVVGVPGGSRAMIDLRALMSARGRIHGTVLRARPPEEKALLARDFEKRVVPQFERGLLRAVVGEVFPAPRAERGHRIMEENRSYGKILLRWS